MDINQIILDISEIIWGWPLIIIFVGIGIITTVALNFLQFRYFITSWKYLLFSEKEKTTTATLTPFQAFISALGSNIGNGSIAGMATAIYSGGPGAAFWLLIAGIFSLIMRFAEIFLSVSLTEPDNFDKSKTIGGPMVYIKRVPGGKVLTYIFMLFTFFFGLIVGNAMQANSIGLGIQRTWGINKFYIAAFLFLFIIYVMSGGSKRIIQISDKLVPFKVAVFIISAIIVLIYHYNSLLPALKLIFLSAFTPQAVGGAVAGYSVQLAMRYGISQLLTANEAGLGTAGIFFGATKSHNPMKDSIMAMLSAFISTYFICFIVCLAIVASGVWNNGQTSTALTISAFETVFGQYGGWIVTFISASFGLGVLVPYAFLTRETWLYLTNGRWQMMFSVIYCFATLFGSLAKVDLIWNSTNILNAVMLLINLYAVVWLLPFIRKNVLAFSKKN